MSIPGSANPLLLATAAAAAVDAGPFSVTRSLRFDSSSSSSLTKSFSSNGDRQKWTLSFWIKRSKLGTKQQIFGSQGTNDSDYSEMYFDTDDKLFIRFGYTSVVDAKPAAVFRDVSAWYHIVIALDTQNSTANNRLRVYVNGTEIDDYTDDSRANFTGTYGIGRAGDHKISGEPNGSGSHIDGYMTEIHYVNGSQKAPTDFAEVDSNNNWNPKAYDGNYGTNGFYLKCSDNTSNASLGTDSSGNNNTFTVTNLIATAGLETAAQGFDVVTYTGNGGTQAIGGEVYSSFGSGTPSGTKTYDKAFDGSTSTFCEPNDNQTIKFDFTDLPGGGIAVSSSLRIYLNKAGTPAAGHFTVNGTNLGGSVPSGAYLTISGVTLLQTITFFHQSGSSSVELYAVEVDGSVLTDGVGFRLGFQPDLVWIKNRDSSSSHFLYDAVRGFSNGNALELRSNGNNAQGVPSTANTGLTSFDSNGFSLGSDGGANANDDEFVAWAWKANGAGSALNTGSIPATVSANNTYGFSIVKYEGTGANGTVAHGLSTAPKFFFGRNLDDTSGNRDWIIYHESIGNTGRLKFTSGTTSTSSTFFQDTSPSDSLITIGTSNDINKDDDDYILYCWTEIAGFSKFGSFSHASTTSLTLGFKPKFFLIKETDGETPWYLFDAKRDSFDDPLFPSTTGTEANGFAFTASNDGISWVSGSLNAGTYIYAAFADTPPGEVVDSLIDTPTNYDAASGNNGGNHATWSPLVAQTSGSITLSNGNLDTTCGSTRTTAMSTWPLTGKTYWEITFHSGTYNYIGMTEDTGWITVANNNSGIKYTGYKDYSYGWQQNDGKLYNTSNIIASPGSYSTGDVVGWAYDADNNTLKLYKNGSLVHIEAGISDAQYYPAITHSGTATASTNFGQRPFAYTPPTGHKSLCTQNLTAPIENPSTVMDVQLWDGNAQSRDITTYNFSPDWVWIKQLNATRSHNLFDKVRGENKPLFADLANKELSDGRLTAFLSNGFTLDSDNAVNDTNGKYVGFAWDAGDTTVTNNSNGTITPTGVRANQAAGFSIVTYTGIGDGSTESFGHGLNAPPELVLIKNRSNTSDTNWAVYHKGGGAGATYRLNDDVSKEGTSMFDDQHPSSTVVHLKENSNRVNNPYAYVAYCFTPISGYSAFGTYVGNNSTNGPYVQTGFRPHVILLKRSSPQGDWVLHDTTRTPFNGTGENNNLSPNKNRGEDDWYLATQVSVDYLSNGFKLRHAGGPLNDSGDTYIWAAWAENPFKTARAR